MGMRATIQANTGKDYPTWDKALIPLYEQISLYCSGHEKYQFLQLIEPLFDNQACRVLAPIINSYYDGVDYTEHDYERFKEDNPPVPEFGFLPTEETFLKHVAYINSLWHDINDYTSVIKRLDRAIDHLHNLGQDPVSGYGPSAMKSILEALELAKQEGAEKIRLEYS